MHIKNESLWRFYYFILFSPEAPVNGDVVIEQDIRQASFGAVLRDNTDVGDLDTPTNKFA